MKKINLITGFFLAALLFFVVTACDTGSGGQGADFDETQYYTKTEVNAAIDAAVTDAVNQAADALNDYTPAITPVTSDGPPKEVQQSGYANRIGPWTVPDGVNFGIFRITIPGYDAAVSGND